MLKIRLLYPGLWIRIHFMRIRIHLFFFSLRIRIQLLFECGSGSSLNKFVKKSPYEEFYGVEKDEKDCSKVKTMEQVQIYCNFFFFMKYLPIITIPISLHFFLVFFFKFSLRIRIQEGK